jgi:glycosyltransferase involved in cell wall biosynthesis
VRICLLSARFPPQRCGVGDYTCFLAVALARLGFDVDVLTAQGEFDEVLYPLPPKVQVHRVIDDSWHTRRLREVVRYIRRLDPRVLLIQYTPQAFDRRGITFAINLLPALVRVLDSIRVVTNFHEVYMPFGGSIQQRMGAIWQRVAARLLASGSHVLSITAPEWEECLRHVGIREQMNLIPVGSNIPMVTLGGPERAQLRSQLLGGSEGLLIAGFGAQHDRDIPAALFALSHLKKQQRTKLLWIGGDTPPDEHRLCIEGATRANDLGVDDLEWTGVLPHTAVSKLLAACDLMLLPFVDGVSTRRTSAVTALQHGLPLLTTTGVQLHPWFIHGQNVYLVPRGDRRALANGLLDLAGRPALRTNLAQGGRTTYEKHFSWEIIGQRVCSLLQGQKEP